MTAIREIGLPLFCCCTKFSRYDSTYDTGRRTATGTALHGIRCCHFISLKGHKCPTFLEASRECFILCSEPCQLRFSFLKVLPL